MNTDNKLRLMLCTRPAFDEIRNAVNVGMMFATCVVKAREMMLDPVMKPLEKELREHVAECEKIVRQQADRIIAAREAQLS